MICEICGKEYNEPHYLPPYMVCSSECFYQKFWVNIRDKMVKQPDRFAIINGEVYFIGDEETPSPERGYGGRSFKIRFLDTGREITSTNLWHNGSVRDIKDSKLRMCFKNNAEFV